MNTKTFSIANKVLAVPGKVFLPALLSIFLLLVMFLPEIALAADSDVETEINTGLKYIKFFFEMFLWGVLGLAFLFAALWVLQSINAWRSNDKDGTIGNVILTLVIALVGVGVVAVMVAKGLTIVEDNIKDSIAYNIDVTPNLPSSTQEDKNVIS